MLSRILILSLVFLASTQTLAQDDNSITFPYEVNYSYNGIKIKIIWEEIECGPDYCEADFTVGFQNPLTSSGPISKWRTFKSFLADFMYSSSTQRK